MSNALYAFIDESGSCVSIEEFPSSVTIGVDVVPEEIAFRYIPLTDNDDVKQGDVFAGGVWSRPAPAPIPPPPVADPSPDQIRAALAAVGMTTDQVAAFFKAAAAL